jgi:hypothetical protein
MIGAVSSKIRNCTTLLLLNVNTCTSKISKMTPVALTRVRSKQSTATRFELDAEKYLAQRSELLHAEFLRVDHLAQTNALPEASVTDGVLKITPLDNQESDEAELLTRHAYGLMPRIKITDLLTEVDGWCDFGRHFTNLRSGDAVSDRSLLLTAILADGINLGLTRMADACPGVSLSTLSRIATWHIRDETYAKALAEVVNHHHRLEFAAHWGDGTTSSSDGQRFKAGASGEAIGSVNRRDGRAPHHLYLFSPVPISNRFYPSPLPCHISQRVELETRRECP